jgi:hypothetical protein
MAALVNERNGDFAPTIATVRSQCQTRALARLTVAARMPRPQQSRVQATPTPGWRSAAAGGTRIHSTSLLGRGRTGFSLRASNKTSSPQRPQRSGPWSRTMSPNSKCFIWCRLGTTAPFFLSLSCTEVGPNFHRRPMPRRHHRNAVDEPNDFECLASTGVGEHT